MKLPAKSQIREIGQIMNNHAALISIIFLAVFFFAFYPDKFISIDEHDYLRNSILLSKADLRQECVNAPGQFDIGDYCISKYNIGTSIFLLPAAIINPQLAFVCTFAAFVVGIILFRKILAELNLHAGLTYLYALYPPFVYYARTLFSNAFSATLITGVFYLLLKQQKSGKWQFGALVGVLSGLAVLVRYTNVIPLAIIILGFVIMHRNWKSLLAIIGGGTPFAILFFALNFYLYGHPFRSGYHFSGEEGVYLISQAVAMAGLFCSSLILLYPGMLISGIWAKFKYTWITVISAAALIIFYAGFPNKFFEGRLLDLIVGIRFIIPIVPLLLLSYANFLNRFSKNRDLRILYFVMMILFGLIAIMINFTHQQFLIATVAEYPL